ncbi:hypothetical protein [Kitasatospora purpeofusca]|uniref:Lipoprotein n=1 Tax=Kitasatospora purpeofusca TaxID=67352 RepID=A0ABZ1TTW3_9ACTN|nr:hypothetical protein [Kitasatospora purpeofusca]
MVVGGAVLLALVGCSATGGRGSVSDGSGPELPAPPPTSAALPSTAASAERGLEDWPTEPTAAAAVPEVTSQVIGPGYTGGAYVSRLAATWGITPKERERIDFPGRPPVWHSSGVVRHGDTVMWIAALWSFDGELIYLTCQVTATAAKQAAFLRDCAGLDHPGARPAAAKAWLDGMKPRVDTAFAAAGGIQIYSPLLRSGPVASVLSKLSDPSLGGDAYELRSFGTGPS